MRSRGPFVLLFVLIAAFVGIPAAGIGFWWWTAGRALDDARREVEADQARPPLPIRLKPLFADPLPDDAGEHFRKAFLMLEDVDQSRRNLNRRSLRPASMLFLPREQMAEDWPEIRPAAEELRKGLRCSELRQSVEDLPTWGLLGGCLYNSAELARLEGRSADALDLLVLLLGMSISWSGSGDVAFLQSMVFEEWSRVLSDHSLTAPDLQRYCGLLDRLTAMRPSLLEVVERECLMRRRDAAVYAALGPDDNGPTATPDPGWRELWSRRLLAFQALKATESDRRELLRICARPPHERYDATTKLESGIPDDRVRIQEYSSHWKVEVEPVRFGDDAFLLMEFNTARIQTALAWHEREKGRLPHTLDELLPRYLAEVGPCPATGKPIDYRDGVLTSIGSYGKSTATWTVHGR